MCRLYNPNEGRFDIIALVICLCTLAVTCFWFAKFHFQMFPKQYQRLRAVLKQLRSPKRTRQQLQQLPQEEPLPERASRTQRTLVLRLLYCSWLFFTVDQIALSLQVAMIQSPRQCAKPCRNFGNLPTPDCPYSSYLLDAMIYGQTIGSTCFAIATVIRFSGVFSLLSRWRYYASRTAICLLGISGFGRLLMGIYTSIIDFSGIDASQLPSMYLEEVILMAVLGLINLIMLMIAVAFLVGIQREVNKFSATLTWTENQSPGPVPLRSVSASATTVPIAARPTPTAVPPAGNGSSKSFTGLFPFKSVRHFSGRQLDRASLLLSRGSSGGMPLAHRPMTNHLSAASIASYGIHSPMLGTRRRSLLLGRLHAVIVAIGTSLAVALLVLVVYLLIQAAPSAVPLSQVPLTLGNAILTAMLKLYAVSSTLVILRVPRAMALADQLRQEVHSITSSKLQFVTEVPSEPLT
ncbi:hypothetical protein BC828DRAFT_392924 [Blastocladiella britannica]|nr:hypothetical protein BC828DRAFT_392924 [Blastocladiella britannica]